MTPALPPKKQLHDLSGRSTDFLNSVSSGVHTDIALLTYFFFGMYTMAS